MAGLRQIYASRETQDSFEESPITRQARQMVNHIYAGASVLYPAIVVPLVTAWWAGRFGSGTPNDSLPPADQPSQKHNHSPA